MLNERKFRTIYDDYKASGLTVREYCSNLGMNEAKFYYWKKKLQDQKRETPGFVPLVFEQGQSQNSQLPARPNHKDTEQVSSFYEISYINGTSIKLNSQANIEMLQQLLQLKMPGNV